jgi:hypothetical protein
MAGDTNKAPPGWESKVDEHGSVHLVRTGSYVPPYTGHANQQTSTATTKPSAAPPASASKDDLTSGLILLQQASQQTSTATTTPSAAPPTSDSKGDLVSDLILSFVILSLYFLPFITASKRGHRNRGAIGIMNLFLGWTGLGWVGALIWACTANTETSQR